jgi:hypothetical protein
MSALGFSSPLSEACSAMARQEEYGRAMLALGKAQSEMVLAGGGCRHMIAQPSQAEPFITDLWNYICTLGCMATLLKPAEAFANPGADHGCHLSTSASASSVENEQTKHAAQCSGSPTAPFLASWGQTKGLGLAVGAARQAQNSFLDSFLPASANAQGDQLQSCAPFAKNACCPILASPFL